MFLTVKHGNFEALFKFHLFVTCTTSLCSRACLNSFKEMTHFCSKYELFLSLVYPLFEKLRPIYKQTTIYIPVTRGESITFWKCLISFVMSKFWENTGMGVIIFYQILCVSSAVLFPFKADKELKVYSINKTKMNNLSTSKSKKMKLNWDWLKYDQWVPPA